MNFRCHSLHYDYISDRLKYFKQHNDSKMEEGLTRGLQNAELFRYWSKFWLLLFQSHAPSFYLFWSLLKLHFPTGMRRFEEFEWKVDSLLDDRLFRSMKELLYSDSEDWDKVEQR